MSRRKYRIKLERIRHRKRRMAIILGVLLVSLVLYFSPNIYFLFINCRSKAVEEMTISDKFFDIPYCYSQAGCYVENGLYLVAYTFSTSDICLFRCYDSNTDTFIWEKHINACSHVNAICFRPYDRRLYIADCLDADGEELNSITVVEYDNIEKGVVDTIISPARGNIIGLGYDRENDTFYSTNYRGGVENEVNVLFVYEGIFEKVNREVILDDFAARYTPCHNSQGLQSVVNGISYIVYFEPECIIAGFDVNTGELRIAASIPSVIDGYKIVELQSIMYNHDKESFVIVDARGLIEVRSSLIPEDYHYIDKANIKTAKCRFVTALPYRFALCSCYIEDHKYVICNVASDGDGLIMRCYDQLKDEIIWTEFFEGKLYANTICFRPKDRRLYLANSFTYCEQSEVNNTILVFDYDHIKNGIVEVITSPARGGIYSIAYDPTIDTFYSTNYKESKNGEANVLFSYNGVFESVRGEVVLNEKPFLHSPLYSTMGVKSVVDDIAYYLYYSTQNDDVDNIICGYDIKSGKQVFSYHIPPKTDNTENVGKPEAVIYNYEEDKYYLQSYTGIFCLDEMII